MQFTVLVRIECKCVCIFTRVFFLVGCCFVDVAVRLNLRPGPKTFEDFQKDIS